MSQLERHAAIHNVSCLVDEGTSGEWFDAVPGERLRIRVDSRNVEGAYTVVESIAQAMVGPPLHRHRQDEVFHVLEGRLTFQCGTERFEAPAGSMVIARAGTPHCWFNFGPEPARMVVTFTPGGLEEVFLGLAQVALEDLPAYAAQHNIDVLGLPLGCAG